jgi:tetratricopeptide (TPR) repeat protein
MLSACASHASPEDAQMANSLCAQGKTLLASGKTSQARDMYQSALHRDNENARAWNGLGASYDLLGNRDEAKAAYEHAVNLAPDDLSAVNNLAHFYLETGDAEAAVSLLEPHTGDQAATLTMRQNLDAAAKAARSKATVENDHYADLGSYPTEGMAKGHVLESKNLLGSEAEELTFSIMPEVKVGGGTPVFTIKVTGKDPQDICDKLFAQAIPCVTQGKH